MYGAYYPYLYGRAGPSRPFYQYERFNQELYPSTGVPLAASSSTSASSHSPCSPLLPPSLSASVNATQTSSTTIPTLPLGSLQRHITKEEDLTVPRSETEATLPGAHNDSSCSSGPESPQHHQQQQQQQQQQQESSEASGGRAQYVSATCVVVTHYSGDVANVVDEHFTRALNFNDKNSKESCNPMSARNFPASFWNSNYVPPTPVPTHHQMSDLYSAEGGYSADPWVPHAAHYGSYAAHAHAAHAHAYHHNMAQYGSLLRLPQQYGHSSRLHHDQTAALESAAAYSSYPMTGLETQVPESSKDLYWF
ncbi:unnamed protein product [Diamesa tonsa]